MIFLSPEEYDAYMKKLDQTFKTEVIPMMQQPKVADTPPIITAKEQVMTTAISGQVGNLRWRSYSDWSL